jgi:NAD(P)-dependent dehydrogenase (short-subunit alcohol dehydrogenase family)
MNRLKGRVAVVTGGSLGIGQAIVRRMAEEGALVAILDVLDTEGDSLEGELRARGRNAKHWHCDVAREGQVASVLDAVAAQFGQ